MPTRALALVLLFALSLLAQPPAVFPGATWEPAVKPESLNYSTARLNALKAWLESTDTTALMVTVRGRPIFEYGDLKHVSYIASCRKSVLAMMYGKYVENKTIDLNKTLEQIGLDDVGGLLPRERAATIEDLISARSGIYHAASNPGDDTASAPPRGPQQPGTYFLYNNWDFNAAGAVFEKLTGKDIYDAFQDDIGRKIGLQDFDRSIHQKNGDSTRSQHMAYHFNFSTRDMARIGLLMLRSGDWNGAQVISRDWARRISSLITPVHDMNPPANRSDARGTRWGYGYMWWVWDASQADGPFYRAYTAMGAGGQFITVLPRLDMVIAHKTDMQQPSRHAKRSRRVTPGEYLTTLHLAINARCGGPCEAPSN